MKKKLFENIGNNTFKIIKHLNESEFDQCDEAKVEGYRLSPQERKSISKNLHVFPELNGLKMVDSFTSTLGLISKALNPYQKDDIVVEKDKRFAPVEFELDLVTGDILLGKEGSRLLTFSKDDKQVGNSRISFSWYNTVNDQYNPRYEVTVYVT